MHNYRHRNWLRRQFLKGEKTPQPGGERFNGTDGEGRKPAAVLTKVMPKWVGNSNLALRSDLLRLV